MSKSPWARTLLGTWEPTGTPAFSCLQADIYYCVLNCFVLLYYAEELLAAATGAIAFGSLSFLLRKHQPSNQNSNLSTSEVVCTISSTLEYCTALLLYKALHLANNGAIHWICFWESLLVPAIGASAIQSNFENEVSPPRSYVSSLYSCTIRVSRASTSVNNHAIDSSSVRYQSNALLFSLLTNSSLVSVMRSSNLEGNKKHVFVLNRCYSLVQWGDFFRALGCRFSLLEVVSTAMTTTVSAVPVREEVLALGARTICALYFCASPHPLLATRSYDGMFREQDDLVVIIQIFASRGIITTLIMFGFSCLILPFASSCFFFGGGEVSSSSY